MFILLHNINQYSNISLLGFTIQGNCKFSLHIKAKLHEANKCLKSDACANAIVLSKILYQGHPATVSS